MYVLFMDVVGFSSRDIPHQTAIVKAMNRFVKEVKARFKPDASQDKLLFIPTGDGMAVAFLDRRNHNEIEEPIKWAWAITACLNRWNEREPEHEFEIRIGLHSGKVEKIMDPYKRPNIAGPGINIAQRVMDCGNEKHILASEQYGDDLINHSDVWRKFLVESPIRLDKSPTRLRVKGNRTIAVYNLFGELDGQVAGFERHPEPKPRVEDLPKDLRRSVLLAGELIKQPDYGKSSLALCLSQAHQRRLMHISGMHLVRESAEKWNNISEILDPYEFPGYKYMELSSIIQPDLWAAEQWRRYQEHILRITSSPATIARRLHVVSEADLTEQLEELISLILAEFICSVRGRVFKVSEEQVVPTSSDPAFELGYRWQDFALFDCGTYYREGANYDVIFTDIKPYFKLGGSESQALEFAVYVFGGKDARRDAYEELRANFFRGWHNRQNDRVLTLLQIIGLAEQNEVNVWDAKKINAFLPRTVKLKRNWESQLSDIILEEAKKPQPDRKAEDLFFDRLPTLRES